VTALSAAKGERTEPNKGNVNYLPLFGKEKRGGLARLPPPDLEKREEKETLLLFHSRKKGEKRALGSPSGG